MNNKEHNSCWLRLDNSFFDNRKIKILLTEDRDCVLFYIEMLIESISHEGHLIYDEKTPHTAGTLANLFGMKNERVEECIEKLVKADLLKVLEDGTFYIHEAQSLHGKQ